MQDIYSPEAAEQIIKQLREQPNVKEVRVVERKEFEIKLEITMTDGTVAAYYLPVAKMYVG